MLMSKRRQFIRIKISNVYGTFIIGINILFEIKPGKSKHSTGCLPKLIEVSLTVFSVSSLVRFVFIISTSFIIGTGFIKCMPITFDGLSVASAILLIDIDYLLPAVPFYFLVMIILCYYVIILLLYMIIVLSTQILEPGEISGSELMALYAGAPKG